MGLRTMGDTRMTYGCDFAEHDSEGRVWECLAPLDHVGSHFINQVSGPAYDFGDFGGMST